MSCTVPSHWPFSFSDQDQPLTTRLARERAIPPRLGLRQGHGLDEVDRRTALDRIDQECNQHRAPGVRLVGSQHVDVVWRHGDGSRTRTRR